MTTQKKLAFGGQSVEELVVGKFTAEDGTTVDVTPEFLEAVARNYDPALHEAPAVIGHPESNAPAYGWVANLKVVDGKLVNQFVDVDPAFEEMVRNGKFKKRSASFYIDPARVPGGKVPYLKHIGFLGAKPPAVKGLKNIQFSEGASVEIEIAGDITFSEGETAVSDAEKKAAQEEVEKSTRKTVTEFLKELLGGKEDKAPVSFSEADRKKLVADAVAAATANFSEELKKRDTKIAELTGQVNRQGSSGTRTSILSFCESVGAERLIPALKNMGVVEFMETLASIEDGADTKVTVISFSETEKKDVEVKISPLEWFQNFLKAMPPFISFGEQFGSMKLKGDGSQIANPAELDSMRGEVGLKKSTEAAAAK